MKTIGQALKEMRKEKGLRMRSSSLKRKFSVGGEMDRLEALKRIDWDFSEAATHGATHAMHPYPAKFIPQIPRRFIERLSKKGDTVYDPFLGSGTTAAEANIMGRDAIGNDANELAVLIAKAKTTPIPNGKLYVLNSLLNRAYKRINRLYAEKENGAIKPEVANLDLWFKDFVISELAIIKEEIEGLDDPDLVDFSLVALSGIIISVSEQDSDTRYARVVKKIGHFDAFSKFSRQLNKLIKMMKASSRLIGNGKSVFKVADTRKENIFRADSADLAVTSPPYPNAYDYHLYHKYRFYWLGMNPRELRKNEIGAHADYSKKNGPDEFDFMNDMEKCLLNTSRILKRGGYFVLVIGDSILKGRKIKNNEIIRRAAEKTPFDFAAEFARNLKLSRKSFNPKIGNIKTEKILVFKNLK